MELKDYISSGQLEAFVLGALSEEENAQVLADMELYPEVAEEVAAIEVALLSMAMHNQMAPPADLQDKIWNAIEKDHSADKNTTTAQQIPLISDQPKTIPFPVADRRNRFNFAAIWVALIGSVALNAMLWWQNGTEKTDKTNLLSKVEKLEQEQKQLSSTIEGYNKGKQMMADTGMQTIVMHSVLKGHPMAATLYWSKATSEAYVMIDGLPQPPQGMQYQLWVIKDGKPVDMGMISNDMANTPAIQKMSKQLTGGEAFAISLEKKGGSPSPTVENIYVMGKAV